MLRLGLGVGLRSSVTEMLRKFPFVTEFLGDLVDQHSGLVVREMLAYQRLCRA